MRILHIGDIVGAREDASSAIASRGLRRREQLDFVVANAENAAGGTGMTPDIYRELIAHGVDCVTLGDHIYRRREIIPILQTEARIVKPANYPASAPGRTLSVLEAANGTSRWPCSACSVASSCDRSIAPSKRSTACWPSCPPTSE